MLTIENISLRNFKAYVGDHELVMPTEGLVFVEGVNETSPELGSNGAGKSTLPGHALCWAWYGRTPRGETGAALLPWTTDETDVVVTVTVNGKHVQRMWTSRRVVNTLTVDGSVVTQEELEDGTLCGLKYPAFLHSVLHAQHGDTFIRMTPSARATLLSECVRLDTWMDYSKLASARRSEADRRAQVLRNRQARLEGVNETLKNSDYVHASELFEDQRKIRIRKIMKERKPARLSSKESSQQISELMGELLEAEEETSRKETSVRKLEDGLIKLSDDLRDAYGTHARNTERSSALKSRLAEVEQLVEEGKCPTCEQEIGEVVTDNATRLKKTLGTSERNLKSSSRRLKAVRDAQRKKEKILDSKEKALESAKHVETRIRDSISKKTAIREQAEHRATELLKTLKAVRREKDPYKSKSDEAQETIDANDGQLRVIRRQIDQCEFEMSATRVWAKGFKEVRGLVLSQVLQMYEAEVEGLLFSLGMGDWKFRASTGDDSKGVTAQIILTVTPPGKDEGAPIESYSGGETTRLEFAAECALSNLIQAHLGISVSVEIWDEPTQYLNKVDGVVEMLNSRAEERQCAIIYIDHKGAEDISSCARLLVRKTINGSLVK